MWSHIICFEFFCLMSGVFGTTFYNLSDLYINDLILVPCNANSVIQVKDVTVEIGHQINLSGTAVVTENLEAPIKVIVILKKKVLFAWVKVPCKKNIGSCTYEDLCHYGYPETETCPQKFVDNGVPCRCPIQMGNYTLPRTNLNFEDEENFLTGKYKGSIVLTHSDKTLACYLLSFRLKQK